MARAIETRWRCPPESWRARRSSTEIGRPTRARTSRARPARSLAVEPSGPKSLLQELAHGEPGRQRGAGILEDELGTPTLADLDGSAVGPLEADGHTKRGGLAAAAFPNQRHRATSRHLKRQAVDRHVPDPPGTERLRQLVQPRMCW
jgi:hypothetical protein